MGVDSGTVSKVVLLAQSHALRRAMRHQCTVDRITSRCNQTHLDSLLYHTEQEDQPAERDEGAAAFPFARGFVPPIYFSEVNTQQPRRLLWAS